MENRGQKYHRERIGEALREEIGALVEGELGDPRIGLVSVSEVHLEGGSRTARVFVVAAGDETEAEQSIAGLNAARGYIRRQDRRTVASNSEKKAVGSNPGPQECCTKF